MIDKFIWVRDEAMDDFRNSPVLTEQAKKTFDNSRKSGKQLYVKQSHSIIESTPTLVINPSGEGKTKIVSDALTYKNGVNIWLDQNQELMTREVKQTLKKGQYRQAQCPVCSTMFNEYEGIDVEKGEVCCSEECASQFETL